MRAVSLLLFLLALTACQTTYNTQVASLNRPGGTTKIALMPVDVELSELTAFAGPQPRAEWTDAAKEHLAAALKAENSAQGLSLAAYDATAAAEADADRLDQISKLHGAVVRRSCCSSSARCRCRRSRAGSTGRWGRRRRR
jgi:hypothetical protein